MGYENMRLEGKVLKALGEGNASVSEIAEEILVSPKKVLKALEYLAEVGALAGDRGKSDINPLQRQKSELIKRVLRGKAV